MISASMVKELRETTGAGMLDCKKALEASNGNMEDAITWLREKGISKAAKKASRIAAEGLALTKVKGNKAVIVEVNSETDFVAKNEEFKELVNAIAETVLDSDVTSVEEANKLTYNGKTIEELVIEKTSTIGEKLSFRRFQIVTKEDSEVFGTYSHMGGKIATLTAVLQDQSKGVLDIGGDNAVKSFREKKQSDGAPINAGYMVFQPEIFDYLKDDHTVLEREPLEKLAEEGQLMSYMHKGFWQCMDTKREKDKLEALWNSGNAPWKIWKDM